MLKITTCSIYFSRLTSLPQNIHFLQIIASVGLDKKLYTFDSSNKKPIYCAPYEAPFSSLVFRDDGNILAAGTNSGRVVFYDVRGKPQPFTVLRAYNSSEVCDASSFSSVIKLLKYHD